MRGPPRERAGAKAVRVCLRLTAALASLVGSLGAAVAHEPLWGETPTIFGPGVFHPEIRIGLMRHGGASEPGGEGSREFGQEYGLQYGINRFVNVRVQLPVVQTDFEENVAGTSQKTRVAGIGDALLSAKVRFRLRQETSFQSGQALVVGWKVPTGDDDRGGPGGERLLPSEQPGSGRHGVEIGYAVDRERLVDSAWTSAFYRHEFGRGFRRGDTIEFDAAYGRWVVRPNVAEDLGVNLPAGVHAEAVGDDRLEGGVPAGNAHRTAGLQVTPIITKGRNQYRVGVFVPLLDSGDERETNFNYEVRAGWEMFF
ncbi:MAG TPA: transporter [Candidatus Polarisedimenticolia bacterium]|nr:transporter [Candidatus Polarisedimenticolia bacterium]